MMDKKEKLQYLSQWSGLQKDILGNLDYGYKDELEKIAKEAREQYKRDFEALRKTLGGNNFHTLTKQYSELLKPYSAGEQAKKALESMSSAALGLNNNLYKDILEQQNKEAKKLYESLNPSLTSTIENLTNIYGSKDALTLAMENLNSLQLANLGAYRNSSHKRRARKTSPASKDDKIEVEVEVEKNEPPIKITQVKLHNFRFFYGTNDEFVLANGESMLLYGENGSGKSSLYKAFELLIKGHIGEGEFKSHANTHNPDAPFIEFEFDKEEDSLKIDEDHLKIEDTHLFVKNLSVFKPMLDYKDLLRIYFATSENDDGHNLFTLFKELLSKYPIEDAKVLSDLEGDAYFTKLKEIVLDLEPSINAILKRFDFDMLVDEIACDAHSSRISIKVSSAQGEIPNHAEFLNEAKLSALALSIFFAVILKIYSFMPEKSLKILVLDDLLLSLNMSNREKVLELLLDDGLFENFQFFIFTHDRAFFERSKQIFNYRQRGQWKYFEMYIDRDDEKGIEFPHIKKSNANIEKAKEHFNNKDYPASANYLRKEVEDLFDEFLKLDKLDAKINLAKLKENMHIVMDISKELKKLLRVLMQFENCERMPEAIQAQKCREFSNQVIASIESITVYIEDKLYFEEFEDVKLILKSILHPQSHNDVSKPLYKKELEDAIELMEAFSRIIEN